jgi:parallel beta-helix repeat protein
MKSIKAKLTLAAALTLWPLATVKKMKNCFKFALALAAGVFLSISASSATYYVATNGVDSPTGGTDPNTNPWRTIQYALDRVGAGDTVHIRQGVYREQLTIKSGHTGTAGSLITVDAYSTNDTVVIKGSEVVTGWVSLGNNIWKKTGWTVNSQQVFVHDSAQFSTLDAGYPLIQLGMPSTNHSIYVTNGNSYTNYHFTVMPPNPTTNNGNYQPVGFPSNLPNSSYIPSRNPDLEGTTNGWTFFISLADATNYMATNEGTFYFDSPNSTLYVRLKLNADPTQKGIEASTRSMCLNIGAGVSSSYFQFKKLNFRHSNVTATTQNYPAVWAGHDSIFEDCDIQWCDFGGIQLGNDGKALNCVLSNNGNNGGGGFSNILFSSCLILSNNYRIFGLGQWHCGGLKIIQSIEGIPVSSGNVTNCTVAWNKGPGIWFDTCRNGQTNVIRDNFVHHNQTGIMFEISSNAFIYNNLVLSNDYYGIYLSACDNAKVYNNTIISTGNPHDGLNWVQGAIVLGGLPREGYSLTGNKIYNNLLFNNGGAGNAIGADLNITTNGYPGCSNNRVDFNCFFRSPGMRCTSTGPVYHTDLTSWRAATGFDSNSLSVNPVFSVGSGEDWALACNSPLIDRGTNLTEVTDDYIGTARQQQWFYDIGAFENWGLKKGDFNLDSYADILWRNYSTGSNALWFYQTTNRLSTASIPALTNLDWTITGTADFTGDCNNDILWRNTNSLANAFWFFESTNRVGTLTFTNAPSGWFIGGTGDFNGDGQSDIVWRNYTTGSNVVWFMDGTNKISGVYLPNSATNLNWTLAGVGDFNRDGKNDLLWRYYANDVNGNGNNTIWYMDGTNRLGTASIASVTDLNWQIRAVGDFNMDGKPDIVWRYMGTGVNQGKNSLWLMDNTNQLQTMLLDTVSDLNWEIVGPK